MDRAKCEVWVLEYLVNGGISSLDGPFGKFYYQLILQSIYEVIRNFVDMPTSYIAFL
jgi:hypothetical protein